MVKVYLDCQQLWQGRFYGPGEVEVPDALANALGLKPAIAEPDTEEQKPSEPAKTPKSRRKEA